MEEFERLLSTWQKAEEEKSRELLDDINRVYERMLRKQKEIEELAYERNLIMNNLCDMIKKELRHSYFNIFKHNSDDLLNEAWKYCNSKETDKSIDKSELKTSYDYAVNKVTESFFGKLKSKVKFKEMYMYRPLTGYDYVYKYKDQEITIFIPSFIADENTYRESLCGYRVYYKASDISRDLLFNGLDWKDLANKLQTWMKEEGWKK